MRSDLPGAWLARGFCLALCCLTGAAWGERGNTANLAERPARGDLAQHWVSGHPYERVRSTVIEAIEGEGLVASPPLDFADMLARTGPALGRQHMPVQRADILQFCSARLAWQLLEEKPGQLALCPLSFSLSQPTGEQRVLLSWRLPLADSPGRAGVHDLYRRLLARIAADLPDPDPAPALPGARGTPHRAAK